MAVNAVSNSAAELGQILQNSQKMQIDLVDKMLKTQMSVALSTNPAVGSMLDSIA